MPPVRGNILTATSLMDEVRKALDDVPAHTNSLYGNLPIRSLGTRDEIIKFKTELQCHALDSKKKVKNKSYLPRLI